MMKSFVINLLLTIVLYVTVQSKTIGPIYKHPFATQKIEKFDNKVASRTAFEPEPSFFYDLDNAEELFTDYVKKYGKQYHNYADMRWRFGLFCNTLRKLNEINSTPGSLWISSAGGLDYFADWTPYERQQFFPIYYPLAYAKRQGPISEKKSLHRTKKYYTDWTDKKPVYKTNSNIAQRGLIYDLNRAKEFFEIYCKKFHKYYFKEAEEHMRFEIFYNNLKNINAVNLDPRVTWIAELDQFSDWTDEELKDLNGANEKNSIVQAKTEKKTFYEFAKREKVLKQLRGKGNIFENSRSYRSKKYYAAQKNKQPEYKVSSKIALLTRNRPIFDLSKADEYFEYYLKKYKLHYENATEKQIRFDAFIKNLKYINQYLTLNKMVRRNNFPLVRPEIKPNYDMSKAPQYFQSYIDKFNRQYASTAEREMRFDIFYHTLEEINAINSDPIATWTVDLNQFSDWTEEELDQLLGYDMTENSQNGPIYDLNRAEEYFENFITEHDRHYDSLAEKNMRFDIFYITLKTINSVNSDPAATWTADTNDFSDWTDKELQELLDFKKPLGNEKETILGVIGASEYFKLYTEKFNKYYSSTAERDMRFGIFYNTLAKVNEINSDPMNTWSAALNKYSDRTEEELHALYDSETLDQKLTNGPTYSLNNAKELFEIFIRMFGRQYDSLAEKLMRFAIFYDTLKTINLVNSDPTEKWFADINDYSDRTDDELMNLDLSKKLLMY